MDREAAGGEAATDNADGLSPPRETPDTAAGAPVPRDWLRDRVRAEGRAAAEAGVTPSECPYRKPDSLARLHWLEGYQERATGVYPHLVAALHQAVMIARAHVDGASNVIQISCPVAVGTPKGPRP